MRAAAKQKTDLAQARSEQAVAWAERSFETSQNQSMAQAHYEFSAAVLKEMTPNKAEMTPATIPEVLPEATTPVVAAATPAAPLFRPTVAVSGIFPKRTATWRDFL